jgi:hypothetical protein
MDPYVKPHNRASAVSAKAFQAGDRVLSYLFLDEKGDYARMDLFESEIEHADPPDRYLCRWVHTIPESDSAHNDHKRQIESAEALFLSMIESESTDPAHQTLLAVLTLMLERKRVLKPVRNAPHRYWHAKLKREFQIPAIPLTELQVIETAEQLALMVLI